MSRTSDRDARRALSAALLLACIVAGCSTSRPNADTISVPASTVPGIGSPAVTVTGTVSHAIERHVFAIAGHGGSSVLVVTRSPQSITAGQRVRVTGSSERFDRRALEIRLHIRLGAALDHLNRTPVLVVVQAAGITQVGEGRRTGG